MKACSKCRQEKSLDDFYAKRSAPDGKASYCKPCSKAYCKQRYRKNREQALEASKRNYLENREDRLLYKRQRYADNREEIVARNVHWRDSDAHRRVAVTTVQHCHLRGKRWDSGGRVTYKQVLARLEYFGWRCKDCRFSLWNGEEWIGQVHHQIPLSENGTNWASNLVPLCVDCHYQRHDG